ncbi:GDP-mannose 4,6-dehydratase [Geothrix sp. 21YS21S-4]|uniref:GDP-mannose 4,6-dehydratase n=1 Tax=Geothrix sp. 21YS21S-4 TaxID=3068889 RepID=UPI0027BAD0FF|nr:GDP-mannose 4,6-dehydratase [Geothrix sp. 21YS21S-4]
MSKKAFITGITGQDGSYLAELLLEKGYEVHGLARRSSLEVKLRIDHLLQDIHEKGNRFFVHYGDMTDSSNLVRLLQELQPDEIYNLAAQSHVRVSFETPEYTANADAIGTLRLLEAIRILKMQNSVKFYQASTSELYGKVDETPQRETTRFYPRSPYGVAKLYAYWATVNYREAYDIFASNGILFNHESPRRGDSFVTQKIALGVRDIVQGKRDRIYMGNIYAKRDWGYAPDYVEAMWMMLQHDRPDDFVVATGETHTVKEFIEKCFAFTGKSLAWEGEGVEEKAIDTSTGRSVILIDPWYFRPTEVDLLVGDPTKIQQKLGWRPKVKFDGLVEIMMREVLK